MVAKIFRFANFEAVRGFDSFLCDTILIIKGENLQFVDKLFRDTSEGFCELEDTKSSLEETVLPSETKKNPITHDIDDFKFQECHPTSSSVGDDVEQLQFKINKADVAAASS